MQIDTYTPPLVDLPFNLPTVQANNVPAVPENPWAFSSMHMPGSQLWCDAVSLHIKDCIERDSVAEYQETRPGRDHLGASEVGNPCSRAIWYGFRWVTFKEHDGRMHRLFQRGHREEEQFIHRLKRIGIEVSDTNPETGKQWRVAHPQNAHFGGSLDAICRVTWLPEQYQFMLGEFKTHNDKSFVHLVNNKVAKSKPKHFSQMSVYGRAYGFRNTLYMAVNKNDDDIEPQVNPTDNTQGDMLAAKALEIIDSRTPPKKYSHNPSQFECKFCDHKMVCHFKGQPHRTCRSCDKVTPLPDGTWSCAWYGGPIPEEVMLRGCKDYSANV